MLLLLQSGSVKIGEVVRFTVTYTPSLDRILPSPEKLYLRIRNTSNLALRAAFVHGPYSLSVAAYPATFDPNKKFANARRYGVPEFEPMVKAGGSWECELIVPEEARQTAGVGEDGLFGSGTASRSVSWVIEVASQVIFSTTASVGYEVVVARDHKSLNLSLSTAVAAADSMEGAISSSAGPPDSTQSHGQIPQGPSKGIFSRAIHVLVEDTAALWNKPHIPGWSDVGKDRMRLADEVREERRKAAVAAGKLFEGEPPPKMKKKKIHLVILTHGLHSNLGADLLFLKESIDAGAKKARADAKARRAKERRARQRTAEGSTTNASHSPNESSASGNSSRNESPNGLPTPENSSVDNDDNDLGDDDDDDDDEEVVVKGYTGNATRTERGIKFLGKRLARYVLALTYPDQPYHPEISRGAGESLAHALKGVKDHKNHKGDHDSIMSEPSHHRSTIRRDSFIPDLDLPYKITSISFLGHSLGGLIQTYAVAYIQKHSPRFFDYIRPINFVALATPFLGLSNENPMYVKFALDFGLVGRTGQDLGLTWRPPTLARSGWSAIVSNLGETAHKKVLGESQTESKPLLRILPTGPAHTALRKFRNRTVYSNVVNDGIVPLRTSCLLFLDWQGLGRVEKARREGGLVETVVAAGWAELTGANTNHRQGQRLITDEEENEDEENANGCPSSTADSSSAALQAPPTPLLGGEANQREVPQPSHDVIKEDDRQSIRSAAPAPQEISTGAASATASGLPSPFSGFFSLFKSSEPSKPHEPSDKQKLIYHRSQTLSIEDSATLSVSPLTSPSTDNAIGHPSRVTTGSECEEGSGVSAPPRTTFFESAHDIINPKVPDVPYLVDPSKRARTIFHDRVYHPEDIPPPLKKRLTKRKTLSRRSSVSKKGESSASDSPISPIEKQPATDFSSMAAVTSPEQKVDKEKAPKAKDKEPELVKGAEEADNATMRVEEKIARAYHRGLSWRKVLVKLEPDAHNNIIVRRMFPNAYGWPVVHHVVESHFSDLASARLSVDDDDTRERAMDPSMPPNKNGRETTEVDGKGDNHSDKHQPLPPTSVKTDPLALRHTTSETLEAKDLVPDMLPLRKTSRSSKHDPISPVSSHHATFEPAEFERKDSMTWSDRDWNDSEPDSDSGPLSPPLSASFKPNTPTTATATAVAAGDSAQREPSAPRQRNKLKKPIQRQQNPQAEASSTSGTSSWNWADAIVGKRQSKAKAPAPVKIPDASLAVPTLVSIPATPLAAMTVIPAPVETPPSEVGSGEEEGTTLALKTDK